MNQYYFCFNFEALKFTVSSEITGKVLHIVNADSAAQAIKQIKSLFTKKQIDVFLKVN